MAGRRGIESEDAAAEYLQERGYTIITRRFKTRHGELDVVALDGDVLVIVEVKQRATPGWLPEEAVDGKKVAALAAATEAYLLKIGEPEREVRFDVIAIDESGLRHHKDAFRL